MFPEPHSLRIHNGKFKIFLAFNDILLIWLGCNTEVNHHTIMYADEKTSSNSFPYRPLNLTKKAKQLQTAWLFLTLY